VIRIYAAQGFSRFVLCLGHKGELIEDFVRNDGLPEGLDIECVQTGEETPTGGRIAQVRDRVERGRFCVTYADGVADIDLAALLGFHAAHGALATMTVVRPHLQFGVAHLNGEGVVMGFEEKPRFDGWINGGFFCFEPPALDYLEGDSVLERAPLERLAAEGQLRAYRHTGFWDCMDTYKDAVLLNDLWEAGRAPWKESA
jgi:glucose-1-phosphate cytidylyltransferase